MNGPGVYDPECGEVREKTQAETVILIVLAGSKGSGFSVQTRNPFFDTKLPELLRNVANEIQGLN